MSSASEATSAVAKAPAARPAMPPPSSTSTVGDGKWLVLLAVVLLPGLYVIATDSDADATNFAHPHACYSVYWYVASFVVCASIVVFLHLLVWLVPRPVSTVDNSPLSYLVVALVLGAPFVFGTWTTHILLLSDARLHCAYEQHAPLWNYFFLLAGLLALGAGAFLVQCVRILFSVARREQSGVAAAPAAPGEAASTEAGTFTSDPRAMLDNGRYLVMESRKIKQQEQEAAARRRK